MAEPTASFTSRKLFCTKSLPSRDDPAVSGEICCDMVRHCERQNKCYKPNPAHAQILPQ